MAEQKFLIVMRSGPIPGSSYFIEKDEVFLGRDLTNDLPVPDPEISRRHARFLRRGDAIYIEDLGSTNGTFLNGVRIAGPQQLTDGDLITLAENTVMSFEVKGAATEPLRVSDAKAEPALYTPEAAAPAPTSYQPVSAPVPQQPIAPAPTPERPKKRMGWCLIVLLVLLALVLIVGVVLVFMPASWWCAISFNQLPGCPIY
ncbi:MAG: FHA domain-containing protein [Anaerolineaceae bacterium]